MHDYIFFYLVGLELPFRVSQRRGSLDNQITEEAIEGDASILAAKPTLDESKHSKKLDDIETSTYWYCVWNIQKE